jgi:hypothetical protein
VHVVVRIAKVGLGEHVGNVDLVGDLDQLGNAQIGIVGVEELLDSAEARS